MGLAGVCLKTGRPADAERLYQRSLEVLEAALGSEHPELVDSLVGLASIRKEQGRSAEAIDLYERALRLRETVCVPAHPEVEELRDIIKKFRTDS